MVQTFKDQTISFNIHLQHLTCFCNQLHKDYSALHSTSAWSLFTRAFQKLHLPLFILDVAIYFHRPNKPSSAEQSQLSIHSTQKTCRTFCRDFSGGGGCWCVGSAADSWSAGGRNKVHVPVLPPVWVDLIRCYGNSCDEGRSARRAQGQPQFPRASLRQTTLRIQELVSQGKLLTGTWAMWWPRAKKYIYFVLAVQLFVTRLVFSLLQRFHSFAPSPPFLILFPTQVLWKR